MTQPVTVDAFRARAQRLFDRDDRFWAASVERADGALLDIPLHPPTERAALSDLTSAREWVDAWRRVTDRGDVAVTWARRDWPRVGSQEVPERAALRGANAIAQFAGRSEPWVLMRSRLGVLRGSMRDDGTVTDVLRSQARAVAGLDSHDFERLVTVLSWLRAHDIAGERVRELPIRGIDTKWVEKHRGLVEALHRAGTGTTDLPLMKTDPLVRVRFLDHRLAPGGLTDVSAPVSHLARLTLQLDRVFVFENLTTVLAMPAVAGAVVIDGGGYRVDLVARLPWAQTVTYWGDLDSDGFAILHRLRSHGVTAASVLMDVPTLLDHRGLWGVDDNPNTGVLPLLTPPEKTALRRLGTEGNVRLEQERIPWSYALPRLLNNRVPG